MLITFTSGGGRKVLDLLALHPEIAEYYSHFLTPGQIFTALYDSIKDARAELDTILHHLIARQFAEQQYTRLEQAGSEADTRPGIHKLYIDLPFAADDYELSGMVAAGLARTAAKSHRHDPKRPETTDWRTWHRHPDRARVWFLRGGPGQGKSTAGQYFCQLQRAALILQTDCIPVAPRIRVLAEDFRASLESPSLWPVVPRIPIGIELRDYAQWFGQLKRNQPRGVLTFLASRLSADVEQPVTVGTLRRALATRSWLVVFDGLDEVPHDVKDSVAAEILNFLDNVALEARSDLFALCTSRPQGYAGQFADLDGPTIDLTPLSPEQALRCAQPVLALGRSEAEATAHFQILKSAMESTSVRELMTTPLQSHIMAVVVRDGGRPPERRWQLYNNFYQVIKRREANRDLPDRSLARLLREDTQLLKSVHNRLGFLLHARAETSRGAQTRLDREEFRSLLRQTVAQMIEGDIDRTVSVLMEATSDRLVLVNTPDDGNHVRFDIRPLQEFFAAEFLYDSTSAEELGRRISLIAGDAHWREVIHFLLSAFVENGRLTELSVAVDVLETLNSGDDTGHERLLMRRLGRGALLVTRLLIEGVLEQDKRGRQLLRRGLEPIAGFISSSYLDPFHNLRSTNSVAWLVGFLIDTMREVNLSESIGAAKILVRVLPDGHPRVRDVEQFLRGAPSDYLTAAVAGLGQRPNTWPREHRPPPLGWVLEVVIERLTRPDWIAVGPSNLRSLTDVLRAGGERTYEQAHRFGLIPDEIDLLRMLLAEDAAPLNEASDGRGTWIDYGLIKALAYEADWTTKPRARRGSRKDIGPNAERARGVLQLVYRMLRFAHEKTLAALHGVGELFPTPKDQQILESLHPKLSALVPCPGRWTDSSITVDLRSLTEAEFDLLARGGRVRAHRLSRPVFDLELGANSNVNQWKRLLEDLPVIALQLWTDPRILSHFHSHRPAILEGPEAGDALLDMLTAHPTVLVDRAASWGYLLSSLPSRADELRHLFRKAAQCQVSRHQEGPLHPFLLDLPADAGLMPHLVLALATRAYDQSREPEVIRNELRDGARGLVGEAASLTRFIDDENGSTAVRAAAVVLSVLFISESSALRDYRDALVRHYDSSIASWYMPAVSSCVSMLGGEHDDASRAIVGALLDAARDDYVARADLDRLLAKWRETSSGPLSAAGVVQTWFESGGG